MTDASDIPPAFRGAWVGVSCVLFAIFFPLGNVFSPILAGIFVEFFGTRSSIVSLVFESAGWALLGLIVGYVHGSMISKILTDISVFYYSVLTSVGILLGVLVINLFALSDLRSRFLLVGGVDGIDPAASGVAFFSLGGYYAYRVLEVILPATIVAVMQALALATAADGAAAWILRSLLAAICGSFIALTGLYLVTMTFVESMMLASPPPSRGFEARNMFVDMIHYFALIGGLFGFVYSVVTFGAFRIMTPKARRWGSA